MTNFNDLTKAGQNIIGGIENELERRSDEKAQELVNKFNRTRGFWVFLHIGIFGAIFVTAGAFFGVKFSLSTPVSTILGFIVGVFWWNSSFTKKNPFISSVLAFFLSCGLITSVIK